MRSFGACRRGVSSSASAGIAADPGGKPGRAGPALSPRRGRSEKIPLASRFVALRSRGRGPSIRTRSWRPAPASSRPRPFQPRSASSSPSAISHRSRRFAEDLRAFMTPHPPSLGDPLVEAGIVPPLDPRTPGSTPAAGPFPRGFPDQGDRLEGAVGPRNLSPPRAPAQHPPTDAGGRDPRSKREAHIAAMHVETPDVSLRPRGIADEMVSSGVEHQDGVGAAMPER